MLVKHLPWWWQPWWWQLWVQRISAWFSNSGVFFLKSKTKHKVLWRETQNHASSLPTFSFFSLGNLLPESSKRSFFFQRIQLSIYTCTRFILRSHGTSQCRDHFWWLDNNTWLFFVTKQEKKQKTLELEGFFSGNWKAPSKIEQLLTSLIISGSDSNWTSVEFCKGALVYIGSLKENHWVCQFWINQDPPVCWLSTWTLPPKIISHSFQTWNGFFFHAAKNYASRRPSTPSISDAVRPLLRLEFELSVRCPQDFEPGALRINLVLQFLNSARIMLICALWRYIFIGSATGTELRWNWKITGVPACLKAHTKSFKRTLQNSRKHKHGMNVWTPFCSDGVHRTSGCTSDRDLWPCGCSTARNRGHLQVRLRHA